ncbi:MAG: helix-turn-helix transcriptional regulator [Sedimentibacter sp.]|uniref:helix-turn-helix domain-containing protein n=1 Tax=Sedimentibacter sp. TaxID=1960295 RepID=UPI0029818943|nr:helix-turn-helix transcriptional regulator [Sedimentibacter sp.]MDW5300220.1 helix-turn-helix transcriptional regulator [Sedimentibacter sp.]
MNKVCMLYYKTCRESAGIKQEIAAEHLNVSIRSLSDYENGKARVPDDIVDSMAELYRSPLLAWWHLKTNSVLGKYLPDVFEPKTEVDMVFQGILAKDKLSPIVEGIKEIMSDGTIDDLEEDALNDHIDDMRIVNNKLTSIILWHDARIKKESRPKATNQPK